MQVAAALLSAAVCCASSGGGVPRGGHRGGGALSDEAPPAAGSRVAVSAVFIGALLVAALVASLAFTRRASEQQESIGKKSPRSHSKMKARGLRKFVPELVGSHGAGPFDEQGLLHYMGTLGGEEPYSNPAAARKLVSCSASPSAAPDAAEFVGRENKTCRTQPGKVGETWFQVDLKVAAIAVTHYSLRHGRPDDGYCPRGWELQGSRDGTTWELIDRKKDRSELWGGRHKAATWQAEGSSAGRAFRSFRVVSLGNWEEDRFGVTYFHICGLELYGAAVFAGGWRWGRAAVPDSALDDLAEWADDGGDGSASTRALSSPRLGTHASVALSL